MESDKPDLNSILESAHLEMYRRASQEELNEATKEIILTRSKDQEMEDASGPLFERNKESAVGVECSRAASGKSVGSQKSEASKEAKDSRANSEIETEGVDVEGEESSNKNFDSSTMTLGDQGSFQNQAELTSQTTYTNIHELTGPVKDDILVVTNAAAEPVDANAPSLVSQDAQETSDMATLNMTNHSDVNTVVDVIAKPPDDSHNQMAFIRGWKSDPCRETRLETIVTETLPQDKIIEETVDKGDSTQVAGAGTREGSPVRINTKLMQEVARRLSQLELEGNHCNLIGSNSEDGSNLKFDETSKDSTSNASEDSPVRAECRDDVENRGFLLFDNPNVTADGVDDKQVDFVEHYRSKDVNKLSNIGKSEKSMFEDEGFVDSKDLLDSTKIIFISDQEDEQSCKPFETEDDTSCLLEASSAGRSLDLHSDLEAKPSLTDVHPFEYGKIRGDVGEADADSNRIVSLEGLESSTNEDPLVGEEATDQHGNIEDSIKEQSENQQDKINDYPKEQMEMESNNYTSDVETSNLKEDSNETSENVPNNKVTQPLSIFNDQTNNLTIETAMDSTIIDSELLSKNELSQVVNKTLHLHISEIVAENLQLSSSAKQSSRSSSKESSPKMPTDKIFSSASKTSERIQTPPPTPETSPRDIMDKSQSTDASPKTPTQKNSSATASTDKVCPTKSSSVDKSPTKGSTDKISSAINKNSPSKDSTDKTFSAKASAEKVCPAKSSSVDKSPTKACTDKNSPSKDSTDKNSPARPSTDKNSVKSADKSPSKSCNDKMSPIKSSPSDKNPSVKTTADKTSPAKSSSAAKTPSAGAQTKTVSAKVPSSKTPSKESSNKPSSRGRSSETSSKTPNRTHSSETPQMTSSAESSPKAPLKKTSSAKSPLNKSSSGRSTPTRSPSKSDSHKTPPSTPRVVKVHSKTETHPEQPPNKKQPKCIGRAIFEMFFKSISEGKSPLPPHLTAILQNAYAPETLEQPQIGCATTVPVLKESNSGTDYESAYEEGSDRNVTLKDSSVISKEHSSTVEVLSPIPEFKVAKTTCKTVENVLITNSPINIPLTTNFQDDSNVQQIVISSTAHTDLKIQAPDPMTPIDFQTDTIRDAFELSNDLTIESSHGSSQSPSISIDNDQMSENVDLVSSNENGNIIDKQKVPPVPPREIKLVPLIAQTIHEVPVTIDQDDSLTLEPVEADVNKLISVDEHDEHHPDVRYALPGLQSESEVDETLVSGSETAQTIPNLENYVQKAENTSGADVNQLDSQPILSSLISRQSSINKQKTTHELKSLISTSTKNDKKSTDQLEIDQMENQNQSIDSNDHELTLITNDNTSELTDDLSSINETSQRPSTPLLKNLTVRKEQIVSDQEVDVNDRVSSEAPVLSEISNETDNVCKFVPHVNNYSDESEEKFSVIQRQRDQRAYSKTLKVETDQSLEVERPLTPYASEIEAPTPNITDYIEPQIPMSRPHSTFGPEFRARPPPPQIDQPSVTVKSPPRPPPRARQTAPPKKKKLNFLRKLFGVKTKSSN